MSSRYYGNLTIKGAEDTLAAFDRQLYQVHTEINHGTCWMHESEFCLDAFDPEQYAIENNYIAARATKVVYNDEGDDTDLSPEERLERAIYSENNGKIHIRFIISETLAAGYSFQNFVPVTREDILSITNTGFSHEAEWNAWWSSGRYVIEKKEHNTTGGLYPSYHATPDSLCYEIFSKSVPYPVFIAMSKQYPDLDIVYKCNSDVCFACCTSLKDGEILENDVIKLDNGERWSPEWEQKKYRFLRKHEMQTFISCPDCDALVPSYCFPSKDGVKCPICGIDMINDKTIDAISAIIANKTIEELDLSVRSHNCLKRAGKNTVGDLLQMTDEDFMQVRNLGKKSMKEVINKLIELKG